jgi:hypothetical protein
MKIVMQCAGSKKEGGYWLNEEGKPVLFVAHPEFIHPSFHGTRVAPDDQSTAGLSWRDLVLEYNNDQFQNPYQLYKAYLLYQNSSYQALVNRFGCENIYILSAGWGLIRSDFLIPTYDITFKSNSKKPYLWRKQKDQFNDFNMLPHDTQDAVVYLGGKDYISLFYGLTKELACPKVIIHNSNNTAFRAGYKLLQYPTKIRTNWHYACASAIAAGAFVISE